MKALVIVRKVDNGFRSIVEKSTDSRIEVGEEIFNRNFHPYSKGTYLKVLINLSPKGRKMVRDVKDISAEVAAELLKIEPTPKERYMEPPMEITMEIAGDTVIDLKKRDFLPGEYGPIVVSKKESAPMKPTSYYVSEEARLIFNTALEMSIRQPQRAIKIMMVGASGYGKTTLPQLFAELSGKNFLRMNCATIRDPEEWFGFREAKEGTTVFIRSNFAKQLERGNVVVVLDEFNRLEPWLHNTLFPLLDDDGATVVHDEQFRIGPGVIVVGTINTGYKYTGTFELDEALFNRFEFVLEVGPLPHLEEVGVLVNRTGISKDEANKIVKVANILRQNDLVCSTRSSLLISSMITSGLTAREAFETAVVKRIPGTTLRKQAVDLINVQLGPFEQRKLHTDIFSFDKDVIEEEKEEKVKKHTLYLSLGDGKSLNTLYCIQLLIGLDVVGKPYTFRDAKHVVETVMETGSITIELKSKPDNLEKFSTAGFTGQYRSVME